MAGRRQGAQDLRQLAGGELAGSTGAVTELREPPPDGGFGVQGHAVSVRRGHLPKSDVEDMHRRTHEPGRPPITG
jgi:hypothetical protein